MEILITDLHGLIGSRITTYQRGLILTIVLCKEGNPEWTWLRVKKEINLQEAKPHLVELHEKGVINWSGYKSAKKSIEDKKWDTPAGDAIKFMNELYGRKFDPLSANTTKGLRARLKEGISLDDIKMVIANRYTQWSEDPVMKKNLNPTTIFRPSLFPKYLEEALRTKEGEAFVSAEKLNLKDGDMITLDIVNDFVDQDLYSIKTYQCDSQGNKRGSGMSAKRYGKDVKKMVTFQAGLAKRGLQEYVYQYKAK